MGLHLARRVFPIGLVYDSTEGGKGTSGKDSPNCSSPSKASDSRTDVHLVLVQQSLEIDGPEVRAAFLGSVGRVVTRL